jgi:hypothetical protein
MQTRDASLLSYVWKYSLMYLLCIALTIGITLFIDIGSSANLLQLFVAGMVTRTMFVQKEQRLMTSQEKKSLVRYCFFASLVVSLLAVCMFVGYMVFAEGWELTKALLNSLFGSIKLPSWVWLLIVVFVSSVTYFALWLAFTDVFKSDNRILAAQQKKSLEATN